MPDERRFPDDHVYREWHRIPSVSRYMTQSEAASLWLIDVDLIEACRRCSEPLLFVEATRDRGQSHKTASILRETARLCDRPAVILWYTVNGSDEITGFRAQWLWPEEAEREYTPEQWANVLLKLRRRHDNEVHFA